MNGWSAVLCASVWALTGTVVDAPVGAREQADPLTAVARRAAREWQRHDFRSLVAGSPGVIVRLGGADASAPLPPDQAARTLHAFAGSALDEQTEVTVVREVGAGRGYAEVRRTYRARGTSARRVQTLYLGWTTIGGAPRLVEVRLVR